MFYRQNPGRICEKPSDCVSMLTQCACPMWSSEAGEVVVLPVGRIGLSNVC